MSTREEVVYVITDLDPPNPTSAPTAPAAPTPDPYSTLWAALQPVLAMAAIVVSLLGATGLVAGLLLAWPPLPLAVAGLLALPVLIVLLDLVGARAGWPPLAWTAARIVADQRSTNKEGPRG